MQLESIDKKFGGVELGYPLEQALADDEEIFIEFKSHRAKDVFQELSSEAEAQFRAMGAAREYEDERLYETNSLNFLDYPCEAVLATHNGKIYKIALTYTNTKTRTAALYELATMWYTQLIGKPSEVKGNLHIWDTNFSRIRVNFKSRLLGKVNQFQVIARQNN